MIRIIRRTTSLLKYFLLFFLIVVSLSTKKSSSLALSTPNPKSFVIRILKRYQSIIMGQSLTTSQWYFHGRRHFTQSGYHKHVKEYYQGLGGLQSSAGIGRNVEGSDGVDMNGKVVVITGANSGIGKELATYVAAKGAKLYMLCRSLERGEKAKQEIIETTQNQNVNLIQVDTGELSQVRDAAKKLDSEPHIHCLVCNAGALSNDKQLTSEGKEVTLASQLIGGSYLLSTLLLPKLENTAKEGGEPRVVLVSSGGMYTTKFPSWEEATNTASNQTYNGVMTYAYAKRGQVLLAEEFSKVYPNIKWISCHPGWVDTIGVDEAFGSGKKLFAPLRSTWEGSEGIAWLMSTNSTNLINGGFYLDRKDQTKHMSGTFTHNSDEEVKEFMKRLRETTIG